MCGVDESIPTRVCGFSFFFLVSGFLRLKYTLSFFLVRKPRLSRAVPGVV